MRVFKVVSAVWLSAVYLQYEAASLCNWFPTFRRNVLPLPSRVQGTLKVKAYVFFSKRRERTAQCTRSPFCTSFRPGLLRAVGETSYGIRGWFIGSYIVFTIFLCICLYLRCKVYSYPVKQTKIVFQQKKKNNYHFCPELVTYLFSVTTPYTTSLTPLSYSTTCVSHPVPLSAANRFSHLTLRWLMSYIYYIYGAPILDVSRSHTTTQHSR